jgi:hypothetical protein
MSATGEATDQILHDARSVRVVVAATSRLEGDTPLTIDRVGVSVGQTIDVGDLLMVIS